MSAEQQVEGVLPQGVAVSLPAPVDLQAGQQLTANVVIRADDTASDRTNSIVCEAATRRSHSSARSGPGART